MQKIFLILLIALTLSLVLNPIIYSEEVNVDGNTITYSTRETSSGTMVELSKKDYKYILSTALSQKERADLWEDRYNNLMEETVWKDSYNQALSVIDQQEVEIERKDKIIKYGGITFGAYIIGSISYALLN